MGEFFDPRALRLIALSAMLGAIIAALAAGLSNIVDMRVMGAILGAVIGAQAVQRRQVHNAGSERARDQLD